MLPTVASVFFFSRTPRCDAFSGSGDPRILQKPPEETVHTRYHGDGQEAAGEEERWWRGRAGGAGGGAGGGKWMWICRR